MDDIRFEFVKREQGPERLVCEAELHFLSGSLAGLKLVGFSIWTDSPWPGLTGDDSGFYVTCPSRAFGAGHDRRYFDYIRSTDGNHKDVQKIKVMILDAYKATLPVTEAMK